MARLSFLLGAGISYPAQLPTLDEITERMLTGRDVIAYSDARFRLGSSPSYPQEELTRDQVPRITGLLELLSSEIQRDHGQRALRSGKPSYEEIYDLLVQIHYSLSGEYEDPLVLPFLERLDAQIEPLLQPIGPTGRRSWSLPEVTYVAKDYVEDVVAALCRKSPSRLDHLGCIVEACRDEDLEQTILVTLNHDTLLETALRESEVEFSDGFDLDRGLWSPHLQDQGARVPLLKLHGSVNWHSPRNGRKQILVGTTQKILEYPGYRFGDLHCRFRTLLSTADSLVICGFSFRDKGVNTYLINWMDECPERMVILIHAEPKELIDQARPALARSWGSWVSRGRARVVRSWIEEADWDEIKGCCWGSARIRQ